MGIFTLSGKDSATSAALFKDALALTTYTYHNLDNGLAWGYQHYGIGNNLLSTLWTAIFGNSESQGIIPGLPWNPDSELQAREQVNQAGWFTLSADELGYQGKTDQRGTFYGENFGYCTAQAEIMGKYNEAGELTQIGVAFRGTSGPRENLILDTIGDAINDIEAGLLPADFSFNYAKEAFGDLLTKVAQFASQHGLSGEDIVVSGHSLGGLAVNSLAALSDNEWGSFYSDANFVAFASPVQYEAQDKVLNVGFENDPVFRVLDGTDLTLSSFWTHDNAYPSTTDNIVNFNDYYVSCLGKVLPESIANLPGWLSHMPFLYQQGMSQIVNSEFYSLTERDSTVIVSTLSDDTRPNTWVEDLNYQAEPHSGPTFIIGSDGNDLIRGGSGNDYLEGGKGNDLFRDAGGYNIIHGGEGTDTLDLQQSLNNVEIAFDGEQLYLRQKTGEMTIAKDIDVVHSTEKLLWIFNQDVDSVVTDNGLCSASSLHAYATSSRGDATDNALTAHVAGEWLFGLEGNDTLRGGSYGYNTFVSGEGDDHMYGVGSNNTYLFEGQFGHDTIEDFGSTDTLLFMGVEGALTGDWHDYLSVNDDDLVLNLGDNSVTLVGVSQQTLEHAHVVFA